MSDRTPPPGIEEVYGNLSAPGASLGLAAVDRKPPPGADELFGAIAPPKPAPAADERRGLLATVADAARGLLAREAPAAPEGSSVGNFRVPASVPTPTRPAGELLTQPNPEAQQPETPAPLSREMAGRLKATLAAMKPEDRALAEQIPGWRGVAAQVLNRQLAAESQGAQRLEMPGASLESRTAYGVGQGMDAPTAASKASAELAAGLPGGPTAQLTAGRPSVLTPEEEAAARADGQGMQKRSTAARGFYGAQEGLAQGAAGVIAAALQAAGDKEGAAIYEKVGKAASVRAESANELKALQAKAAESGVTPSGPLTGAANYIEGMSAGAANSIGQMIPGIAVGLATGSGPAALAVMALPVFGQSYVEKRDAGGAPGASAAYAGLMAGFEVLGERYGVLPAALNAFKAKAKDVPLEELPKFLERGIVAMEKRGLLNKTAAGLVRTQAGEQFGEQLTSAGQYLLDGTALGLDKPVSVTGFLTNARDTAVQTLIATGVMQAGGVAAKKLTGAEGAQAAPGAAPAPAAPLEPVDLGSTKLSGAEVPVNESGQEKPQPAPAAVEAVANIEKLLGTPLDADAHEAATSPLNDRPEPTQAQKDAGNYKVGHIRVQGMDVSIENPRGSVRRGTSPDGTAWENTLAHHYGYLKGTKAIDGDQVDVFIGPNPDSPRAFVVDQVDDKGKFDEPKALIGFDSIEDAKAGYLANYAPGWTGLGAITELPIDAFKSWAKDGTKRKPLGDINGAKPDAGGPAGLADRPADGGGDQPAGSVEPVGELPAAGGLDGVPAAPEGTASSGEPAAPVGDGSGADAPLSREAVGQQFSALADEFAASGRATGRTFQRVLAGYADNIADGSIKDAELPALAEKLAQYRRMLGEPEATPPAPPPVEPEVDTPTERAAGDVLQLDGKAWTITKASPRAITIKNEAGKVRTIAAGSPTWAKIDDQNAPNAAPAAEAVAPAVEAAAPASGDAGTAGADPAARPARAQAARVTKPRKQQSAVRGSPALGAISTRLGGIDPSLLADLSSKVERSRVSKLGKKSAYTAWDNPPHAGKGPLFRAGGSKDLSLIAQMLEEEGFIPAGTYEADPVGAGQQAAEIIRAELRQGGSTLRAGSADDVETEMRRRMEAAMDRFEEHGISPEAVVESGYLDTTEAAQAAWDAAIEALADAESDVVDAFLQSVAEVEAQEERDAIQADSEADAEAREGRGDAARAPESGAGSRRRGPEDAAGGAPATAEGLTSPTPESLAADDRRAKDAEAADAREQKRLADKAKADAERGEFTLTGSDRPADVAAAAGQGDLLNSRVNSSGVPRLRGLERFGNGTADIKLAERQVDSMIGLRLRWGVERSDDLDANTPAAYDRARGVVLLNPMFEGRLSQAQAVAIMAEEMLHGADSLSELRSMTAGSKRLAEGGDIRAEIEAKRATNPEFGLFLSYPLDDQSLDQKTVKTELFARLGVLYFNDPDAFRKAFPTTYEAYHEVFGLQRDAAQGTAFVLRERAWRRGPVGGAQGDVQSGAGAAVRGRLAQRADGKPADPRLGQLRAELARVFEAPASGTVFGSRLSLTRGAPAAAGDGAARQPDPIRGALQSYLRKITETWANKPEVIVINSMADAPAAVRRANEAQMQRGSSGEPAAFTHAGKVYIVARQFKSMEKAAESLFHEALGHLGLRGLFGADLNKVLRQMAASMPDALKAKAKQYGLDVKIESQRLLAAEELLAEIAETRPTSNWVRKAIVAIREWLRKHIPALADLKWRDADIIERVIIPARRFIEEGRSREALAGEPAIAFQRVEGEPDAVFYSDLAGRIADSAMNAGAAGAWKQLLKGMTTSGKIKADEVAWSGLEEWLDLQPGKIGKQQIVDYLAANGVRVTETVLNEAGASFETMSRAEMAEAYERIVGYDPVEDDPDITDEDLRQQLREFANEAAASDGIGEDGRQPAQYGKYTLPGGKNYREVLLTLPVDPRVSRFHELDVLQAGGRMTLAEREEHAALLDAGMTDTKSGNYRSSHWKQPNILAHIRVNDRTDVDGKRVLFVEEIQSDWAQEGKKAGFVGIPAAPFVQKTDAWVALAIKRVVKMAADGGYDRVAFVNGEQAADRFDLSKQISKVRFDGGSSGGAGRGDPNSQRGMLYAYGLDGNLVMNKHVDGEAEIAANVGKEIADRLLKVGGTHARSSGSTGIYRRELEGLDLQVGGEGMKAFYDKIVPSVAKDVLRKLGGSLGSVELPNPNGQGRTTMVGGKAVAIENEAPLTQPGFDITPAMLDKVAGGVPLFQRTRDEPARSAWRDATNRVQFAPGQWLYDVLGAAARPLLIKTGMKAASPELRRQIRAMRLEVQKAQETAVAVARETQKLTEDERLMVSDIIEKELAAGTIPPAHAVRLAALMNQTMGAQTGDLLRLGMLTQETAQRWDGAYLPRFYESKLRKQVGDAWADALRRILGRTSAMKGIKGKHLKGRGLFETIAASDLPAYEALGWEVRDPDYTPGSDDQVQVWRDYTRAERDDMGEIRDAGFRFVMGYMQTQRDIALGKMFEGMAGDPAISSRLPKQGWVQVPNTTVEGTGAKRYGKLGGRYVPEEVLSHLSQIEESQSAAWQMYRKAMSIWKEGKTVLNPVSHVNNILSNLTMAHFAGVGYHRADKYVAAIRDFATKSPTITEAKDAGLFLGTLSDAELMNTLPKELQDLAMQAESKTQRGAKFVYNAMTWFLRKPMGVAYQAEDVFFRYLIYKDARRRGIDPNEAVEYAQKFIFTYDDLPRGARFVRDFGIPFFAYTYKAVPALLHTALTHPVRFAAPAAVLWAANAMAYAIGAGDDDDSWDEILQRYLTDPEFRAKAREAEQLEREHLPPWMKGTTSLQTPKAIRMGMDEVTKLPLFLDVARIVPGGDLFDVSPNAGGLPIPQPITPSHPLFSIGVGMIGNKDLFFGKEIVDTNDTRGEAATKRAEWLWKQVAPALAVGGGHWDRGMNALAQASGGEIEWLPDAISEKYTGIGKDRLPVQPGLAALQTFGIKLRPLDLQKSAEIEGSMRTKMIRDIASEMRSLARLNGDGALSDAVFEREMEKARVKIDRLTEGLTVDGEAR